MITQTTLSETALVCNCLFVVAVVIDGLKYSFPDIRDREISYAEGVLYALSIISLIATGSIYNITHDN